MLGLIHVVRRQKDRDPLPGAKLVDVLPDVGARLLVEPDRGLVKEEHTRRVEQATVDLEPPLHTAGESVDEVGAALLEANHFETPVRRSSRTRGSTP